MNCLRTLTIGLLFAGWVGLFPPAGAAEDAFWATLKQEGHLVLIRHALAPGTGDPSSFTLRDCSTQRNLDERGREQARRIGDQFRAQGIETARVYSSQWCRCLETARLLGLGPVNELPLLNSFFANRTDGPQQTAQLRQWIQTQALTEPVVLITHQVNITALTGIYPASGELVLVDARKSGWAVVTTLETH